MGTKDKAKKNQETLTVDSDCEVLDGNVSSITIPDSPITIDATQSDLETSTEHPEYDPENFIFEVNFKSPEVFDEFRDVILSKLREMLNNYPGTSIVEDDGAIEVFRNPKVVVNNEEEGELNEVEPDLGISGLFMVDTQPAEEVNTVQIPSYKRTIKEILDSSVKKKTKTEDECHRPRQNKSCFNCGETDHDLRSCPKPRNNTKINKAKKMHSSKHERYHVDIEQRFAHLRPGSVSKNLREALGIRSGELPFFFYRMRVLGYPPGWLEDAKVAHSGITLFDSEGRTVRDPEDEDGQVENDKHKYDVNKIISFPGFNADAGKHFYDDHRHHNVPPINPKDFREEFIKTLGDNVVKGYKRKKMKDLVEADSIKKPLMDNSEMEIETEDNISTTKVEFTRPPPPSTPPKEPSPPPRPPPEQASPSTPIRSPSPSLEDLVARQRRLQMELESNVTLISDNDDSLIDDVIELEERTNSSTPNPAVPLIEKEDSHICKTPQPQTPNKSMASAMESVLGTPVLQFSPFDKLPCGDNFKVGVSDVINFENLPDSTGTYRKMKDVIKKIFLRAVFLNNEPSRIVNRRHRPNFDSFHIKKKKKNKLRPLHDDSSNSDYRARRKKNRQTRLLL